MHGSTMMYLFAVPFLEGLALYLLPLMIGSRDVAFPRLTAFGYWTYLFGGLVFYASFVFGQVPDAGWFAYTPLSGRVLGARRRTSGCSACRWWRWRGSPPAWRSWSPSSSCARRG
jgi:heme/copper-type cytochrome/quinol oxidase subunit 1